VIITAMREQLASDLEVTGLPVYPAWPDKPAYPCVVVVPSGSGYVTSPPKMTFGEYLLWVDLLVLVKRDVGPVALAALDAVLGDVLANTVDWGLTRIDAPSLVAVGQQQALGCLVTISKAFRL
jgi:hypothetical protein